MKKYTYFLSLLLCLSIVSCSSGDGGTSSTSDAEYFDYVGSKGAQNDFNVFFKMAVKADILKLYPIYCTMDKDGSFYSRELTQEEFEKYADLMDDFEENIPIYKDAISNLDNNGVFNKTSQEVLKKGAISIASKFGEFFYSVTNTKKEMREKTMEVIGHMKSDRDRQILFDNLSSRYKNNETDYKKWWINFNNGSYDSQSSRIYNEFYHDPDSDFGTVAATEKDYSVGKLVAKKGAELVEKGYELEVEIYKTALPSGLVDGVELVEDAAIVEEIIKKGNATSYEEIKDKFLHFVGDYDDIKDISSNLGKSADDLINYLKKQVVSVYDDGSIDNALIHATDTDSESPAEVMIATNNTTDEITISFGSDDGVIKANVLPGDINVTIVDDNGDKGTANMSVEDGSTYFINISSDEKELLEEQNAKSSSSKTLPASSYNKNSSSSNSGKLSSSSDTDEESSSSQKESSSSIKPAENEGFYGKWYAKTQVEKCDSYSEPDVLSIDYGTLYIIFNTDGTFFTHEDLGDGDVTDGTLPYSYNPETKELEVTGTYFYIDEVTENSMKLSYTEYLEEDGYCTITINYSR